MPVVSFGPPFSMATNATNSERQPLSNGDEVPRRTTNDEDDSATPHQSPSIRTLNENGMTEMSRPPSLKSPPSNAPSQLPGLTPVVPAPESTASSRETSPVRSHVGKSTMANRTPSRSRKSSHDRTSARRGNLPSGQGSNSRNGASPTLHTSAASEYPSNIPVAEKSNTAVWSPTRRSGPEHNQPNTSSKRSSVSSVEDSAASDQTPDHTPKAESHPWDRSTPRIVSRVSTGGPGSTLETVQETSSDPSTPSADTIINVPPPDDSRLHRIDEDPKASPPKQNIESGSESGGGGTVRKGSSDNKGSEMKEQSRRQTSGTRSRGDIIPKRSTTSLSGARGKPADGSARNMIVETETVSSVPQVSLATVTGDRGGSGWAEPGTLRMKPSTETIRPKKEKRRTRKPNATASSKADIFEAKVANAVDEADVSDSDETFVYESNPPDPYPARQHRYHSRTPSTTSMASQVDQYAGRPRVGLRDGSHSVTGKRSMKFTNNTYSGSADGDSGDVEGGRGNFRMDPSTTPRNHHIGRYGRGGVYPSLFDSDSPFEQALPPPRSPRHFPGFRRERLGGPRAVGNYRTMANSKKAGDAYGYDFDAEGADDERTPLMLPSRPTRSRHGRRPPSATLRHMEYMQQRQRGFLLRYGACLIISLLLLMLVGGSTTFIVAVTKPLLDLDVTAIQNVLASEQEIMLDLNVQGVNPNLFPVAVDDLDVNIFARSRFVGTDSIWREHNLHSLHHNPRSEDDRNETLTDENNLTARSSSSEPVHIKDGVDRGTDPIAPTDPAGDSQTMLLGRVYHFDSPLVFDASPWNHVSTTSKGQIRLARPGNKTEEGGTERWERVLQHPFELIVRGVVKYQLAVSSRIHSSPISSSVKVTPDADEQPGNGHVPRNQTVVGAQKTMRRSTSPRSPDVPYEAKASRAKVPRKYSA